MRAIMYPGTDMGGTGPKIPSSFELVEMIDRVLGDWAFLSASPAGKPAPGPAQLPLEFSVALKGSLNCLLVLRSEPGFGSELAQACTGDPSARDQGNDAFRELCNLVASHLLTSFFGGVRESFGPFVPVASTPESWPPLAPDAESVMIIENCPLEVRLWVETAPEAPRG